MHNKLYEHQQQPFLDLAALALVELNIAELVI
jgi:hypothetical protein